MSGTETLLYLVVVPAVIVAVIWALAYRGGPSAAKRYRPGRPYEFTPVWYLANHQAGPAPSRPELEADRGRPGLPAVSEPASDEMRKAVGGASDRW